VFAFSPAKIGASGLDLRPEEAAAPPDNRWRINRLAAGWRSLRLIVINQQQACPLAGPPPRA
jgi:hypothetical protein